MKIMILELIAVYNIPLRIKKRRGINIKKLSRLHPWQMSLLVATAYISL